MQSGIYKLNFFKIKEIPHPKSKIFKCNCLFESSTNNVPNLMYVAEDREVEIQND
jgi:hypothetical protein